MELQIKKYGRNSLFVSVLLIIFSLFLIFKPIDSVNFIIKLLGTIMTLGGIVHIFTYFTSPAEFRMFSFELVRGLLGVFIGIFFIICPELINSFLPIIIGLIIILESIVNFQLSLGLKNILSKGWISVFIVSIFTAILGVYILIHPLISTAILVTVCGISLLISQIINIIEYFTIIKKLD